MMLRTVQPMQPVATLWRCCSSVATMPKLYQGIKKAPIIKSANAAKRQMAAMEEPYRPVPEDATPKSLHTNMLTFLQLREVARRRNDLKIPVFSPGSVLQITALDSKDAKRGRTFVGTCIARTRRGIGSSVTLRNTIDDVAVEKQYQLYSPLIQDIKVLSYERRRRAKLFYLRDRPLRESAINPRQYGLT